MNKVTTISIVSLTLLAIFSTINSPQETIQIANDDKCTEALVVECAADVELTILNCAKAVETEGADVIADLKCVKDLLADKKHCWPCVCAEAKKKGWHIIGC